jgi:DNA polymerase III delta prime subunit
MTGLIRKCPGCKQERLENEVLCGNCGWDLIHTQPSQSGQHDIVEEVTSRAVLERRCENDHLLEPGDEMCFKCGAYIVEEDECLIDNNTLLEQNIDGWLVIERNQGESQFYEQYIVERHGSRGLLTYYHLDTHPEISIYEVLKRLPKNYVPELIAHGEWCSRYYEVIDITPHRNLLDYHLESTVDLDHVREIIKVLGKILDTLSKNHIRHGNIRPENILVRHRDPLNLMITGFHYACLSNFDLDIVAQPTSARYTAPEAIAGGISIASDWWSLGIVILQLVTKGQCFNGINEQAFRIHVVTRGISIPRGLEPSINLLLCGLLARDPEHRWQWSQIQNWLEGNPVEVPSDSNAEEIKSGPAIELSGCSYVCPKTYALAASEGVNWENAKDLLIRGVVTTWLEDRSADPRMIAGVRLAASLEVISDDFRLALAMMSMYSDLPLIYKGDIVSSAWLLKNVALGYEIITGALAVHLRHMNREPKICALYDRNQKARERAKSLEIELDEEIYRLMALTSSRSNLEKQWAIRRRLFPGSDHRGLNALMERQKISDEELIILLGATVQQFESKEQILKKATEVAVQAEFDFFSVSVAQEWFDFSRRDLYRAIEERIVNYSRCGISRVDEWADDFRVERRITLPRALALLSVPKEFWQEPPRQQYVSTILEFFEKRMASLAQRGPLVRMTISRSSPRVDLSCIASKKPTPSVILEHLVSRIEIPIKIDQSAFVMDPLLEQRFNKLVRQAKIFRRDTGIDSLYLGFPFIVIRDKNYGTNETKPKIAPVLLWPIKIDLESRDQVSLFFDRERDDVRLNPALTALLGLEEVKKWAEIVKELLGRSSLHTNDVIDAFGSLAEYRERSLCAFPCGEYKIKAGTHQLICSAVLFHAEFMGQAISEDLRQMRRMDPAETVLATALRVSKEQTSSKPSASIPEKDRYFTIESDPTQEKAVFQARNVPGLLVEGPPGTGKSQTIVNIIGDYIGRKQTVLVICQKSAALEVLAKRLNSEGIGNRFFYITNVNKNRTSVIKSILAQLDNVSHTSLRSEMNNLDRRREELAEKIEKLESEIDKHHWAIHTEDETTGLSYRKLLGQLIELEDRSTIVIEVPGLRRFLCDLNEDQVSLIKESCASIASIWLESQFEDSPFSNLKSFASDSASISNFVNNLNEFVEAEKERDEVTRLQVQSFDIDDPFPLRSWATQHDKYFRNLDASEFNKLSMWREFFRKDMFGKSSGMDFITTLTDIEKQLSDFKVRFTEFAKNECKRDEIIATTPKGFDIDDPTPHHAWIEEHGEFLSNLSDNDWKNISKWFNIFFQKTKRKPRKHDLTLELQHMRQQLELIRSDDFDPVFSRKLLDSPKKEIHKWLFIVSEAVSPSSFFGRLKLVQTLRIKVIKKIIYKFNETPSEDRIHEFRNAVYLEKQLRPLRDAFCNILNFLHSDVEHTELFLKNDLQKIIDRTINEVELVNNAFEAIKACPRRENAEAVARLGSAKAFRDILTSYKAAFSREEARKASYKSLDSLESSFSEFWVTQFRRNIELNCTNVHDLRPVMERLSLVKGYGLLEAKSFDLTNRNNIFSDEVEIGLTGCVLRTIRNNLYETLVRLYPNMKQTESLIPLEKIDWIVTALLRDLQLIDIGAQAIQSCPRQEDVEIMAKSGDLQAYDEMMVRFKAAVMRYEARSKSFSALQRLDLSFDKNFFDRCHSNIRNNVSNITELLQMIVALPSLSIYQEFRIRVPDLSLDILNIFAILREKDKELSVCSRDDLEEIIRHLIAREARIAWKDRIEQKFPVLRKTQKELIRKVQILDESNAKMRELNQNFLAHGMDIMNVQAPKDWEDITRLRGPRMRGLREIIERGSDMGLMQLRPVWLMNPNTASQLLPLRAGMFDVVIFDEASQIPIENALPTLYRAKRAVISGDDKQMPPTNLFKKLLDDDDDIDYDDDEPDDAASETERAELEDTWNRREIKDYSDLLALGKSVLPRTMLQIHYRSKYRELIAFSNAAFYGGNLSVPVRHPDRVVENIRPIELVRVDGIYGNQTNRDEAEKVIDLLAEKWITKNRPSIGVVTFNSKQADLIEDILAERAKKDSVFQKALLSERDRLQDGEDMSFFVKNVENVQGDERDIIIFSSTFGRNDKGLFRRNFGLLGQTGGERRLNVAITRAREKIFLVTSLPIEEISDALSKGQSPKNPRDFLQAYFDYATKLSEGLLEPARIKLYGMTSESVMVQPLTNFDRDGFTQSVETFIKSLGLKPLAIKENDAFGLDFVIEDLQKKRFEIGIECDAHRHPILETARAREIWRPKVLRKGIPQIHRVTSYAWYHNRSDEMDRLKLAIESALGLISSDVAYNEIVEAES